MIEIIHKKELCPKCGADTTRFCSTCDGESSVNAVCDLSFDADTTSTTGHTDISSSGLISQTDATTSKMLGIQSSDLIGKPFTLFVDKDDLVDFFIHRNALFVTRKEQMFEIKLIGKDRCSFCARLRCTVLSDKENEKNADGMRVAIEDYTFRRRTLDQLEHELNLDNIIRTITADMIHCSAGEIDTYLTRALKTLAMFTEVERVFLGTIDAKRASFTLTHEWCAPEIGPLGETAPSIPLDQLPVLKKSIDSGKMIQLDKPRSQSDLFDTDLNQIHTPGTRSFAYFPLEAPQYSRGVIGYDALDEKNSWEQGFSYLFQFAGQAFLHALYRNQNESALRWRKEVIHQAPSLSDQGADQAAIQPNDKASTGVNTPITIEASSGDLLEIFDVTGESAEGDEATKWRYQEAPRDGTDTARETLKVGTIDDKMLIRCPRCMRQDKITPAYFETVGQTVLATCPCQYEFELTSERRSYHRKKVDFEGVFVRTKGEKFLSDSINYSGKTHITNLSKKGLGFVTEGPNNLNVGDHVRIKFTLDNQARSLITKQVLIKGRNNHYVGGEFVGADKHDITLGFYLM